MTTRVRPYLLATAAVAAVFLLRWLLAPVLGSSLPFITFFFAVFFAAWYGGFGPAVFAAVLGGLLAAAVFFPVPGGVDISSPSGQLGLVLFTISGLAMGAMGRARINAQQAAEEGARTANEAASEARAARSKTEAILAGISDGFMLLSRDWKILYLNAAALKLSGRPAAELIGRDHWEVFPESRGTLFESAYRRALERMEVVRVEEYYPPIERWLSVTAYPSPDGLSVFAQDVTEQRQAEMLAQDTAAELEASNADLESALNEVNERRAALEQSEERVRLAMDVGAFGAWEWDIASNRVTWSPRLYEFYGISPEQFGGRVEDFERLVHPADASRVKAARERALETGGEFAIEYRTVQPGGTVRWLSTHARVLRDAADRPARMIGATQDITERRVADERLRQVQRMEAAGRLAGGVAHEVNNQMTIVLGLTSFILRDQRLPDTVRDDMLQIQRAGERSAAITAQLLAFGRRQMLRPEPLQLNEVIADFSRVVEKSAGMSVGVRIRLDPDVAPVVADRAQLEQVLLNLTLNAVDAMPNGGTLTIETAPAHIGPGYVREHPGVAVVEGDYTLIAVSDTGHGMTPEILEHIFEPFFTTKSVGEGSGLGLSSVYGIVKQSDGYVWAYSEPGVGTTFKIYLPASPSAPAPAPVSAMDGRRFAGTESVLVVDDEREVRALIVRLLEGEGYHAYSAGSGHEALDLLRDGTREIHLVVTDVAMPGLSGSELGRRLGELRPGLPVLYTSGFTDADIVARGMLERSLPFLQKPFTPEGLLERIRGILDQPKPPR